MLARRRFLRGGVVPPTGVDRRPGCHRKNSARPIISFPALQSPPPLAGLLLPLRNGF